MTSMTSLIFSRALATTPIRQVAHGIVTFGLGGPVVKSTKLSFALEIPFGWPHAQHQSTWTVRSQQHTWHAISALPTAAGRCEWPGRCKKDSRFRCGSHRFYLRRRCDRARLECLQALGHGECIASCFAIPDRVHNLRFVHLDVDNVCLQFGHLIGWWH